MWGHTRCAVAVCMDCVTCVMLSATVPSHAVPSHDAAFLSLLFQTERLRLEVF